MRKIFYILILFTISIHAQEWQFEGKMPKPVAGGEAIVYGSKIYILGGYSDSTQSDIDWIQIYEPSINKWTFVGSMIKPRSNFVADKYDDKIYYFGGNNVNISGGDIMETWSMLENRLTSDLFILDSKFFREAATGLISNDSYFVFGGVANNILTETLPYIVEYNINNETIGYIDTVSYPQGVFPQQQISVLNENTIYLAGGVYNGISNEIYSFNTITYEYLRFSFNLLEPRAAGCAVYNNNSIYIIGGYNESESALKSIEKIDLSSDEIVNVSELNIGRTNMMAVNFFSTIIVFGGYDENGNVVSKIETFSLPVGVNTPSQINGNIKTFKLYQNYPNPFNPLTNIEFNIVKKSFVTLDIYSITGERVKRLINGNISEGFHITKWDGTDNLGYNVPSGIYIYSLNTDSFSQSKKMVLIK